MEEHDAKELLSLGYHLFPIHSDKKRPALKGWRDAPPLDLAGVMKAKRVGVRLRDVDLVVDVDPRNGGSLLQLDGLVDLDAAPVVNTKSGGWHVYLTLRPGAWRHTLAEMPGVEFKTLGRFVVAPGQPGYSWDLSRGALPAPPASDSLMALIAKPVVAETDDGEWSPAELAMALSGLDPADFRDYDEWLTLMAACHETTRGAGGVEFATWSTQDPPYAAAGDEVLVKWNTFEAGRPGNAGLGTLRRVLEEHGADAPESTVTREAAADFGGLVQDIDVADTVAVDPDAPNPKVARPESLMTKMTRWFKVVDEDGRVRVYARRHDETLGREYWVRYMRRDFMEMCKTVMHLPMVACGEKTNGDDKYEEASEHWLDCVKNKETYKGMAFAPEHHGHRTPDGKLNLWRGFSIKPSPLGSWEYLKELTWESLCAKDWDSYEYVMNWMARAVQRPWEPGMVALVFRGAKGTGKGTLARAFVKLFGQHGLHITSQALLVGRFNSHLRDVAALFADEAFWAGDKAGEGILKGLITEPTLAYEGKGENVVTGRNSIHTMMASNEDWVVPAGMDNERRFATFGVETSGQSSEWWDKLYAEQENGGLAAMLHDLMTRNIGGFDVRRIPQTRELAEQKTRSMSSFMRWLYELALAGYGDLPMQKGGLVETVELQANYINFCRQYEVRNRSSEVALGMSLKKLLPLLERRRMWVQAEERQKFFYKMPPSEEVVARIEDLTGLAYLDMQGME